ncbi:MULTISPECIES: molybdopterin-binding protein [unclassified Saccharibacter]|uniref:competence/damage-inducible protein A n=1 Tax=unclassified Saccharibacter TaxID=2648722 RepID=UPI00132B2A76|nr:MULTISPECIES: competence/damage-inducible protein A [unclassified Saccharibacter]MXV36122.1 competence/damage-inducible protein A [Saccharibacter sp. EH611]MXV56981.1 competence/damage-inducible protein A [Saccharibacter sp. EH70]MXV66659.1 competence/damage-inducible protein A [Saccharibacter sp. EH60]
MSPKTACFLVIGNEVLSGRTRDSNTQTLAHALNAQGITLSEVRVIPDIPQRIIDAVTECRARFDMVFTSGGIGPTHDDITTACIAEAFGVALRCHQESYDALHALFPAEAFNQARQKMAWLPEGSTPIKNTVSTAPGFSIGNVHVMAGVPSIFRAMVQWLVPQLEAGAPLTMCSWHAFNVYEGTFAEALTTLQGDFKTIDLGSYPFARGDKHGVALVAKGYDSHAVQEAGRALKSLLTQIGVTPISGEPAP